jgi:hypothetical protein
MDRAHVEALVGEFGDAKGIADLALDDDDFVSLADEGDRAVNLEYFEEDGCLVLFTNVGEVPEERRFVLYEDLLKANFFWQLSGGATLALNPAGTRVMLVASIPVEVLDVPKLVLVFDHVATLAWGWASRIEAIAKSGEAAPSAVHNPLTRTAAVDAERFAQQESVNTAKKLLTEKAGYLEAKHRNGAWWKLSLFHLFNTVGGVLGQICATASKSSYMDTAQKGLMASVIRDMGQTYFNASETTESSVWRRGPSGAVKAWSEGLGSVAGFLVHPFHQAASIKHTARMQAAFENEWRNQHDEFPADGLKHGMSASKLFSIFRDGRASRASALEEYNELRKNNKPAKAVVTAFRHGSPDLKASIARHFDHDSASENFLYYDWSLGLQAKINETSPEHDPDFRPTKGELEVALTQFIETGSEHELNLVFGNRGDLIRLLRQEVGEVMDARQNAERCARAVKTSEHAPGSSEHNVLVKEAEDAKSSYEQLQAQPMSDTHKDEIFAGLRTAHSRVHSHVMNTMTRYQYEEKKGLQDSAF